MTMIVLTPTEATTLRAVLERVAAEGDEDSATAVAVLDNGELLLGIGRSWELGGDVEFVDTIGGEVEACPDCARIRARIRGLGHIIDGRGDEDGD
jgi:hypothetical protein